MTDAQAPPLPASAVLAAVKAVREDGWSDDTLGTIDRVVRIALAAAAPALRTQGPVAVMQNTQATWLDLPASWPDSRDLARSLTEMLATRYSGQPTQRDLDVAKIAYAAGAAAAGAHPPPADAIKAAIRRALSDPGSVAGPRRYEVLGDASDYESVSEWQTRAVLAAAAPAIAAQAAAAERERIRRGSGRMPGENWYDVPADLLEGPTDA